MLMHKVHDLIQQHNRQRIVLDTTNKDLKLWSYQQEKKKSLLRQ